jgi:quinolinate synthase
MQFTPDNLIENILSLKKQRNAIILAHYYQDAEIQEIADFVGDSLDLSKKAFDNDANEIYFCGVKFMAEVAKILSPHKRVFIPDLKAGCSLEDSCKPADFAKFRQIYPNAIAITYINCSAEIKALSDIIVTSSNAQKIISQIPKDQQIIFAPDQHLGKYISKITQRDMILWHGSCVVHEQFSEKELVKLMTNHPQALVIAHPECSQDLLKYAQLVNDLLRKPEIVQKEAITSSYQIAGDNLTAPESLINSSIKTFKVATIEIKETHTFDFTIATLERPSGKGKQKIRLKKLKYMTEF